MACCRGTASYFCCNPDVCTCDQCCCANGDCHNNCNFTPRSSYRCTNGACCTCNSGNTGYAWYNNSGYNCGILRSCGNPLYFSTDCFTYFLMYRVDTGPDPSLHRMVDFTKAGFLQFAKLSVGLLSNMKASTNATCC
jgi:hypothetical protein